MKSLHDPAARVEIAERLRTLTPANERRWGTMDSSQMLAHVGDQLRMSLGEIPVSSARGRLRFGLMRYLIIHVLPWPKGRAQAPREAFTTPPADWEADRESVLSLIERFGAASPAGLATLNPVFGPMSVRDWGVLSYRHLDHHLRQFGA